MKEIMVVVVPAFNEEKSISKTLDGLITQSLIIDAIIVVDNNSTDNTREIIIGYQEKYPMIHLIVEKRKGTGFACNTGFRYAIDQCGATIISRTDADTVPQHNWNYEICRYFAENPRKMFLAGKSMPKKDEFYRSYDTFIWPIFWRVILCCSVIVFRGLFFLRFGFGHNLSIRTKAYQLTSGFSLTSIDDKDEDLALNREVSKVCGFRAMGVAKNAIVYTSMRRVRKVGYLGFITYYTFCTSKERKLKKTGGNIDVR